MTSGAKFTELESIFCESGVSSQKRGEGFVTVKCYDRKGNMFMGQVDVETSRKIAYQFLEAAEAAISDAGVYVMLTDEIGLPEDDALFLISKLRGHRSDMKG
jgi:hypothetical protein